jgi:hypothetical protein
MVERGFEKKADIKKLGVSKILDWSVDVTKILIENHGMAQKQRFDVVQGQILLRN